MAFILNPFTSRFDANGPATSAYAASVSNSDGTLIITPTIGAVVASINLNNANTWTALQTFSDGAYFGGGGTYYIDSSGASVLSRLLVNESVPYDNVISFECYGKGRFVNNSGSMYAYFADDINNRAGYFTDGANLVAIADGTYALNATGTSLFDGTTTGISGHFFEGFSDVYLANGTYAIEALGDSLFTGDVTISDDLLVDTNTFYVNGTTNRVGIGTVSPASAIHVISTTEQARIGYNTSNYLGFTIGSAGASVLYAVGTTPYIEITTADVHNLAGTLRLSSGDQSISSNQTVSKVEFYHRDTNITSSELASIRVLSEQGITSSASTVAGSLIFYASVANVPTERLRLNSAGNFGIGASTISARAHIISTTEQLRVGYDASNYYSTTVGSTGGVTFDAVGSGAGFTFSDSITLADAKNIILNTTTGTKIGTATTQKLGFYNATPVVQGASVADATGGVVIDAEARTAINALISRIEATGLIATV